MKEPLEKRNLKSPLICSSSYCLNTHAFRVSIPTRFRFKSGRGMTDPTSEEVISVLKKHILDIWAYNIIGDNEYLEDLYQAILEAPIVPDPLFSPYVLEGIKIRCAICGSLAENRLFPEFCDCKSGCDRCGMVRDRSAFIQECVSCILQATSRNPNWSELIGENYCDSCYKGELRKTIINIDELVVLSGVNYGRHQDY